MTTSHAPSNLHPARTRPVHLPATLPVPYAALVAQLAI
jgi:hypothetical protein